MSSRQKSRSVAGEAKSRLRTFTLGRQRLETISAVEGIETAPDSRAMFADFERHHLSDEDRRAAILAKHARRA
jgi:hypothetical protein